MGGFIKRVVTILKRSKRDDPPPYEEVSKNRSSLLKEEGIGDQNDSLKGRFTMSRPGNNIDTQNGDSSTIQQDPNEVLRATEQLAQKQYETEFAKWRERQLERQRRDFEARKRRPGGPPRKKDFLPGYENKGKKKEYVDDYRPGPLTNTGLIDPLRLFFINCLIHDYDVVWTRKLTPKIEKAYWRGLRKQAKLSNKGDEASTRIIMELLYHPASVLGIHFDRAWHMLWNWSPSGFCARSEARNLSGPGNARYLAYKVTIDKEVIIPALFVEPLPPGLDPRLERKLLLYLDSFTEREFRYLKSPDDFAFREYADRHPNNNNGRW